MQVGDRVRRRTTGEEGVVVACADGQFCEVAFATGRVLVPADELEPLPSDPATRLAAGEVGPTLPYALRLQALYLRHAYKYDPLSGLSNARIEPELHQVYVAHVVTQKLRPRMILADEVGLGKTIEAGLIIKELRARGLIDRVLVVCPSSLQLQWQQELRSKFNEEFEILDGDALKVLGKDGSNPWAKPRNVICSLTLARNPKRAEKIVEADWDLVVFDEAHHIRRRLRGRTKVETTQAYAFAEELAGLVDGLLMLTATPMQLHPYELYSLIELVEPGLYPSFDTYEARRRDLPRLNDLMKALVGWGALSDAEHEEVAQRHGGLLAELGLSARSITEALDDPNARTEVMDALVTKHPLSGVLVRNRKAELGGFTTREATSFLVPLAEEEYELYFDVTRYLQEAYNKARDAKNNAVGFLMVMYQRMLTSSSHAIRCSLRARAERLHLELRKLRKGKEAKAKLPTAERIEELRDAEEASVAVQELETLLLDEGALEWEIEILDGLVDRLGTIRDSKAAALLEVLKIIFSRKPNEKVLIFTQFIMTQDFLQDVLETNGYSVARFNGRMKLEEKEDAVARFRRDTQILISTEAGGEGRNFQFAHIMVNYDLPWNPMKVEQRIGRLDRIGQRRPVLIYNLACEGTVEQRVLEVLEKRIRLFRESVGSLDPILGDIERRIEQIVMEHADRLDEVFEEYEKEIEKQVREARERERILADFVLDHASLRRDIAGELLGRTPLARFSHLRQFMADALAFYGGTLNEHTDGGDVISLSPRLASQLRTRMRVRRGVFDWKLALEMEDLDFFAFGHELIDRIVDLPINSEPVFTGARRVPDAPPGESIEIIYHIRAEGLRPSGKLIRHLVTSDLEVRSEELTSLPVLGEETDAVSVPSWAMDAVRASRARFDQELSAERDRLRSEAEAIKDEELRRARRIYDYRRVRLQKTIDYQLAWIEDKERYGSEHDRRILPARRGRLAKDQERLERLGFDYEEEVQQIRAREPAPTAEILAAGVVIA